MYLVLLLLQLYFHYLKSHYPGTSTTTTAQAHENAGTAFPKAREAFRARIPQYGDQQYKFGLQRFILSSV